MPKFFLPTHKPYVWNLIFRDFLTLIVSKITILGQKALEISLSKDLDFEFHTIVRTWEA